MRKLGDGGFDRNFRLQIGRRANPAVFRRAGTADRKDALRRVPQGKGAWQTTAGERQLRDRQHTAIRLAHKPAIGTAYHRQTHRFTAGPLHTKDHRDTGAQWCCQQINQRWQTCVPVSYTHLTLPTNREV